MNIFETLLRLLYPPKCVICKKMVQEYNVICEDCWKNVKQINRPFCDKCSFPVEFDIEENNICGACLKKMPKYIKARSAFIYNKEIAKVVMRFKFFDETYLKEFMSINMVKASKDILKDIDILIPVPLYKNRLRQRKYNQSLLLCREISKLTNKEVIADFLYKKENTKPQVKLKRTERLSNLIGKFAITEKYLNKYKNKSFAIIDDVITTGSTVNECIRVLNKDGINNVYVITFARTKNLSK